jgi:hypothetical protein
MIVEGIDATGAALEVGMRGSLLDGQSRSDSARSTPEVIKRSFARTRTMRESTARARVPADLLSDRA